MFKRDEKHAFKATRQGRSPHQQGTARRRAGEDQGEGLGAPPLTAPATQDLAGPDASPRPTPVREEWLTPDEAAALLRLSRTALYKRVERGLITARRDGRRLLFVRSEIEAYLTNLPHVIQGAMVPNMTLVKGRGGR